MADNTQALLDKWRSQMTDKEKELHTLASVMLKKSLKADMEKDNGSYYPEKSHAFKAWLRKQNK